MLSKLLKKYDKQLAVKKSLDGVVTIYRHSTFNPQKYEVLAVANQYLGGAKWLMRKIVSMDSRRQDFFVKSIINNNKIRTAKKDNRISKDIAEFIGNSGATFVN